MSDRYAEGFAAALELAAARMKARATSSIICMELSERDAHSRTVHSAQSLAFQDAEQEIRALGPAPVDDTAADWPSRDALLAKMDIIELAVGLTIETSFAVILDRVKGQRDRLAAAEARVRVLEGAMGRIHVRCSRTPNALARDLDMYDVIEQISGAALAKKSEGT